MPAWGRLCSVVGRRDPGWADEHFCQSLLADSQPPSLASKLCIYLALKKGLHEAPEERGFFPL